MGEQVFKNTQRVRNTCRGKGAVKWQHFKTWATGKESIPLTGMVLATSDSMLTEQSTELSKQSDPFTCHTSVKCILIGCCHLQDSHLLNEHESGCCGQQDLFFLGLKKNKIIITFFFAFQIHTRHRQRLKCYNQQTVCSLVHNVKDLCMSNIILHRTDQYNLFIVVCPMTMLCMAGIEVYL